MHIKSVNIRIPELKGGIELEKLRRSKKDLERIYWFITEGYDDCCRTLTIPRPGDVQPVGTSKMRSIRGKHRNEDWFSSAIAYKGEQQKRWNIKTPKDIRKNYLLNITQQVQGAANWKTTNRLNKREQVISAKRKNVRCNEKGEKF